MHLAFACGMMAGEGGYYEQIFPTPEKECVSACIQFCYEIYRYLMDNGDREDATRSHTGTSIVQVVPVTVLVIGITVGIVVRIVKLRKSLGGSVSVVKAEPPRSSRFSGGVSTDAGIFGDHRGHQGDSWPLSCLL